MMIKKSKTLIFLLVLVLLALGQHFHFPLVPPTENPSPSTAIEQAFKSGQSNVQVQGSGRVSRILSDDHEGSRHQRFIVTLDSGQTVLIAHNIDLAPRIDQLKVNDRLEFYGVYEWNAQGGVIHWTHHDPQGQHVDGWIKHHDRLFQ